MERDEIAARLAGLSPAKLALLARRRRGEAATTQVFRIGRRTEAGPSPLSFAQQRMWFLDRLEPGTPTYNLRVLLRLSGPLDRQALARSFQEVVHRHEVLRTVFREEAGSPVQVVLPRLDIELPYIDLRGLPAGEDREALRRLQEIANGSFDLAHPPLLKVALAALGLGDHLLLVVLHHIVSDGWSMGVLVREVGALYRELLADGAASSEILPELPIQYADYAVWQREQLTGEVLARDLAYWRGRLAGASAEVDLPTDRTRPAVQTSRGAGYRFAFDAGLMEAVESLARREGATPFMVLAAGLLALLSRLSGQSDLSIGSPIAGRNRSEVEGLIGFFVNTLVLRAEVSGVDGFRGLLRRVREATQGALAHQDVPFEKLVAEIAPERDRSRTPLFQVALAYQSAPLLDASLAGLELHPQALPVDSAKFDLAFIVGGESGVSAGSPAGSLAASLEYSTDLYDHTTAARLCGQWLRLLAGATAAPAADLARLDLLAPAERHQILREWNDTGTADAKAGGLLLHQPFEQRVDLHPEALAAVCDDLSVTYGELEARANRLASFLRKLGAGPEAPVGVWMDRSIDLLVALLGTSKAGAAYLPIDAAWPADRAEAVLAGTAAGIVLTRRDHLAAVQALQWRLPRCADAICLDVATAALPVEPLDTGAIRELFDGVAERAVDWETDWVAAAGFWSAYTGNPFPEAEVVEYRDRVLSLAEPWIGADARSKRVLEIGSGSGLILWELAPRVGRYVGLDPSARTQERNRRRAGREGLSERVELLTGFAHEIEFLPETPPGSFDLVLLASTTQFFPGPVYLERVLGLALSRLAPGGAVVVADVMDPRRREDFRRSLTDYAAAHPETAATRGDAGERELYVDEGLFADLPAALPEIPETPEIPEIIEVRVLHREEGFPNELRFRYDVVLRKGPPPPGDGRRRPSPGEGGRGGGRGVGGEGSFSPAGRSKRVWTGWHVAGSSSQRPRPPASPDDIAYIIHTSGSTGAPKGIAVQHRSAVELCRWANASFGVGLGDRLLFITSPAFDLSVYDVFGILGAGGAVHIAPEEALRDPERLVRLLTEEPVTIWDSAPAALQQLAPLLPPALKEQERRLRLVLLSGDWIPVRLPDAVRAAFPGARVISLGGATEATVWSNWFPIAEVDPRWPSIPYGRPIPNAVYHVLDAGLQPCPIGVPGDLHIGGSCLCVGYVRRPELTAEKFIPDLFSAAPGARLYATGDRARHGADGNLELLGRLDQQVKVRGYRIELGEIEVALSRQSGVREAVVLAREDRPGDQRLVAYVIPREPEAPPRPDALRDALRRVLPEPMVPAAFVILDALPVTANGKLDRGALPVPTGSQGSAGSAAEEVLTPAEEILAGIWSDVLRVDRVGREDSFFDLGGHSLLAVQTVSRVREAFGVELALRQLFETPTLGRLAAVVAAPTVPSLPVSPIPRSERGGDLPLSFAQQRLWFLDRLEPGGAAYNIPSAVRLSGEVSVRLLARVFAVVVRRHETLRTTFASRDGVAMQIIAPETAPDASPELPLVDLSGLPLREREALAGELARAEARRPFDLEHGPLLRLCLVRLAEREHILLMTMHHIVSDGWSMGVLLRELATLYAASPLPELPVQYADFALWQREQLQTVLEIQLAYWRDRLAGAPRALELPLDHPRPAVQSSRGAVRRVHLAPGLSTAVHALGRAEGATPFMVLLAAWALLLGRHSNQEDVLAGTPVAGRNRREIEGLIGFFVNTLVMRTDLSGAPSFKELVGRVRRAALDGYAHQDLPFERLVEELVPERDLASSPLFQAAFALQNAQAAVMVTGLTLTPLPVDAGIAKLDLTLSLAERGDEGFLKGNFEGFLEYNTDLFDAATAARLLARFEALLAAAVGDPGREARELPLLLPAERHQALVEWNDTRAPFPGTTLLHQFFEASTEDSPSAVAAVADGREMTYAELEARSNRLARFLRGLGVGRGTPVGVWEERSLDMIVAVLGVLKAGGHYLALDTGWPAGRVESILAAAGAPVVFAGPGPLSAVEEMRWRLPALSGAVCLGVTEPEPPAEALDPGSVRELWDFIAERAVDRVTAGGFVSAFTGLPFSEAEVDEYRDHVLSLASPWLQPRARVLEIGSGSGLLLWEMASRVAHVTGVDPSPRTQERNRGHAAGAGIENVELRTGFAHELEELVPAGARYDLILLASTVQFFPGPRYLDRVLRWALGRLAPGGAVLVADVLDARRRGELEQAIAESAGAPARRRELFLDEDQFQGLGTVALHHRREGFPNELRFRYDVLLTGGAEVSGKGRKPVWTGWHVDRQDDRRLPTVAGPEDVAYVIHTSGSTGEPKGIVVQHRPAANLIDWINRTFAVGPGDRGLFITSLAFDLSVYDVFGVLAAGGTVHIATEEELGDPDRLVSLLRTGRITLWDSAPAALVRLAPLFPSEPVVPRTGTSASRLRLVLLSGDWIPVTLPDRVRQAFPGSRVIALGGATEATVWSNWFPVGAVDPRWSSIPYGRPIANARYHVLDAGFAPCPIGVPGDLYIGGDCLCAGYARRPDLTAAAFLPDPFAPSGAGAAGARLYRTGDRARYGAGGNLEFLGRLDQQVKIRGYRIELGEIEVALARQPGVREAVVLARGDQPGDLRLVAYVVLSAPAASPSLPAPSDLRDALRQVLPGPMVPAAFVILESMPVTANGKLDRAALPAPQWTPTASAAGDPLTPAEEALAAIWSGLLRVDRVGREDSFFALGGDSILSIQVVSRARRAGLWLAPRDLFQHQTLAELALAAEARSAPAESAAAEEGEDIPLTPIQQWFFDLGLEDLHHFNQALVLALRERMDPRRLESALAAVVARHTALRCRFTRAEDGTGTWRQTVAATAVSLPSVDLSALPAVPARSAGGRAAALEAGAADLQASLDIERGPLLRAALWERGDGEQRLFLVFHHLIVDGVSWRILLEDLETSCRAAELSPVPTSLRQWVARLAGEARSPAAAAAMEHWRALGRAEVRPLPVDRSTGADTVASARRLMAELGEEETRALLQDVPAVYRTGINDALLTAMVQAFAAWTGEPRLLIDLEGHGREDSAEGVDLSRTVGWLTALDPVLLELDPRAAGPGERLQAVKEQLRAVPRGGLGFGALRSLGEPEMAGELRRLPAAQVVFNYLGQLDRSLPESSPFAPAAESAGPAQSPRQARRWLIEVNGGVLDKSLRLTWTYSERRHDARTVQGLIDRFLGALRALIEHCRSCLSHGTAAGFTPADFPEARVSREDLARLGAWLGDYRAEVEALYELSPMQHAMLLHSLVEPGSGVYVVQISLRLSGRLDTAAFLRAWESVVARHAVLRTAFVWEGLEKPLQMVFRHVGLEVRQESWAGLDDAAQRARLAACLEANRERGFDLGSAPLMRLGLFELGQIMGRDAWQLVWSQHHILSDGWAQGVLLGELFTCYAAFAEGREPSLPPAGSYRDYIAWLQRRDLAEAEAFWRRRLAGFTTPALLAGSGGHDATDATDASGIARAVCRRRAHLPAAVTAALREAGRRHRLTLSTLVQGAWSLVLAQATGADEVVYGSTVAGRPPEIPGVESIVGLFINTLPARVEVRPDLRLLPWLAELQERQAEARQYEHAPLHQVQHWSEVPQGTALFDHILVFENQPLDAAIAGGLPGLTVTELAPREQPSYPLSVVVFPGPELRIEAIYDAGRFESGTVARLVDRLDRLLRGIASDLGDQRLGDLPRLFPAERHQALAEWNDTAAAYPREASLAELFIEVARARPDAPAVIGAGPLGEPEVWSYRRLDEATDRLARRLRASGVGLGTAVGIAMERSPELVAGTLAIVKAGGVYVPLDPAYPDERLDFMLADAGAVAVLVDEKTRARLAGRARLVEVLEVEDKDLKDCKDPKDGNDLKDDGSCDQRKIPTESPAYVIYTSGSTGRPKGVVVPQRAVVRLVRGTDYARLGPEDRVAHASNISFDAATFEIWGALLNGGALVVIGKEVVLSPAALAALLRAEKVTAMFLTTALFNQVVREEPAAFRTLRHLLVGGETLDPASVARALREGAPERLLNGYGPTESTTFAVCYPVREAEPGRSVPIGRPIANTTAYVVDAWLGLAPPGPAGELYLGGDGLAHGYLNRPELTAERFVPHLWSAEPGGRLYRTGDLVRRRGDGAIEFLGRIDQQVKIRGFRIEPGEIEAVLAGHPEVRECAVVAAAGGSGLGEVRLVAYAVLRGSPDGVFPVMSLRRYLQERLPEHMLPAAFVILDALPLTANGKLDRRALSEPERMGSAIAESHDQGDPLAPTAPTDPITEILAGIFSEVLGLESVGIHDDFFALGGHSLLATQVASRIRGALGVELPLRRLFETPTAAELAGAVRDERQTLPLPPIVSIMPVPRTGGLPLSFAQQRLWFLDQLEPGSSAYNIPLTVRLTGEVAADLLAQIFAEVVRRHEALRTTFSVHEGRPVQVFSAAGSLRMPVIDLMALPEAEREAAARGLARAAARRPFDLQRGPLLRLSLLRLGARDHLLLLTVHHIVADGWSLGVLLREVAALFTAFSMGRPSPLPELPVQYADFAVWQRSWLRGEALEAQLAYWRRELAGAPRLLELPTDHPRPAVQTFRGGTHPVTLLPALSAAVRGLCRRAGVTPFMAVLAAWAVLLGRCSSQASQEDVLVGSPIAGRNRQETEGLIGFFVNTLVLRVDWQGGAAGGVAGGFGELLGRVRRTALDAFAHQDLPFERLVEELVPERDLAVPPLFQVLFALQNAPVGELAVPGLTLAVVPVDSGTALFDLALTLGERAGGFTGALEHNADLFDRATAERLLDRFQALLAAAVEDPEQPVTDLPLLLPEEAGQLLAWSRSGQSAAAAPVPTFLEMFAARVALAPDAPALLAEEPRQTVSYRELDLRSALWARRLRALGVAADVPVGICLRRSPHLVVALLAVLRAGGAYVPLDPAYPADRLSWMLDDARVDLVLTDSALADRLKDMESRPVRSLLLDTAEPGGSETDLPPPPWPQQAAWIIYTSGSTGRPKGSIAVHGGLAAFTAALAEVMELTPADRVLQFASISFDASALAVYTPLSRGAAIVLHPEPAALSTVELLAFCAERKVTVLELPAALWRLTAAEVAAAGLRFDDAARLFMTGGESLSPEALRQWSRTVAPSARLVSAYGPTETTVAATVYLAAAGEASGSEAGAPLGRPIAGTSLHLLDARLQPVPVGVAGEVFLGGAGVTRGYLGRPDLTAAAFLPDSWGPPGSRFYRTGDRARFRRDGGLEFLGRIDDQVKLRGFRIEPGEVAAVLAGHPAVRECVVVVRGARLVAYVVGREDGLRSWLRARLPEHMVPAAFVFLDALPLTPNGKVDRKALPAPERTAPDPANSPDPADSLDPIDPSDPLVEILAGIWTEVLEVEHVGVHDDFFALGGHSLLATLMVSRIRTVLGVELPLRRFFESPTVAKLARAIQRHREDHRESRRAAPAG